MSPSDYDEFFIRLQKQIEVNPTMQYRIILGAIRSTDCPYLKRKLRRVFSGETSLAQITNVKMSEN
ncbi:MAG: hypothetical protein AAGF85_10085 [Bacteroidota bacterium]